MTELVITTVHIDTVGTKEVSAAAFTVNSEGDLTLTDQSGNPVASFARGHWISITPAEKKKP